MRQAGRARRGEAAQAPVAGSISSAVCWRRGWEEGGGGIEGKGGGGRGGGGGDEDDLGMMDMVGGVRPLRCVLRGEDGKERGEGGGIEGVGGQRGRFGHDGYGWRGPSPPPCAARMEWNDAERANIRMMDVMRHAKDDGCNAACEG
jgi:hypothetical protein